MSQGDTNFENHHRTISTRYNDFDIIFLGVFPLASTNAAIIMPQYAGCNAPRDDVLKRFFKKCDDVFISVSKLGPNIYKNSRLITHLNSQLIFTGTGPDGAKKKRVLVAELNHELEVFWPWDWIRAISGYFTRLPGRQAAPILDTPPSHALVLHSCRTPI